MKLLSGDCQITARIGNQNWFSGVPSEKNTIPLTNVDKVSGRHIASLCIGESNEHSVRIVDVVQVCSLETCVESGGVAFSYKLRLCQNHVRIVTSNILHRGMRIYGWPSFTHGITTIVLKTSFDFARCWWQKHFHKKLWVRLHDYLLLSPVPALNFTRL